MKSGVKRGALYGLVAAVALSAGSVQAEGLKINPYPMLSAGRTTEAPAKHHAQPPLPTSETVPVEREQLEETAIPAPVPAESVSESVLVPVPVLEKREPLAEQADAVDEAALKLPPPMKEEAVPEPVSAPAPSEEPIELRIQEPVWDEPVQEETAMESLPPKAPEIVPEPVAQPVAEVAPETPREVIYFSQPRPEEREEEPVMPVQAVAEPQEEPIIEEAPQEVPAPEEVISAAEPVMIAPEVVPEPQVEELQPEPVQVQQQEEAPAAPAVMQQAPLRWQAARGADVQEVLSLWSGDAGVELLWAVEAPFNAPESFSLEGAYEDAVVALLDQFLGSPVRPVADLYVDPETGKKTLVVQTFR